AEVWSVVASLNEGSGLRRGRGELAEAHRSADPGGQAVHVEWRVQELNGPFTEIDDVEDRGVVAGDQRELVAADSRQEDRRAELHAKTLAHLDQQTVSG